MQKIEQGIYTRQQIIDTVHVKHGSIEMHFGYDLLDKTEKKIGTLDTVESGDISMSSLNDIKKTGKFHVMDKGDVDWLNDRIQPFISLKMPDGGWVKYPQGILLLSTPTRQDNAKMIWRDIDAYDGNQVLKDDKVLVRTTFLAGSNYVSNIITVLQSAGITKINIPACDDTLQADREWEPNTGKLQIINDLLKDINYTTLWVDEWGYYTANKYITPDNRAAEYTYADDKHSIIFEGMEETLDLFSVPNKWVVTVNNSDMDALSSEYTNDNADSLTSTVNRGRTIPDYQTIDYISSQSALDDYVKMVAFQASQVYGNVKFKSGMVPYHSFDDMLQVKYSPLGINTKYEEISWHLPLKEGAEMEHEIRRVVNI